MTALPSTLQFAKSEYKAVLEELHSRGLAKARHPLVDLLEEGNKEDLAFLRGLIARLREHGLGESPNGEGYPV